MSSFVVCPDCKKQLKVPETMRGKAFRCPACKAVISGPSTSRSSASDSKSDEPDEPSPSRPVKTAPSERAASATSGSRPPRDEEPVDDLEVVDEKPSRAKSSRKRRPSRKKSSSGLIIGLVAGGAVLLVLGIGGGLLWYFLRNKTIPEAEWQAFTPPDGNCTVLMPGTPFLRTLDMMPQYGVERKKGNEIVETFVIAFYDSPLQILWSDALESQGKSLRDGLQSKINDTKIISEKAISLGNIPGREYQLRLPTKGFVIARVYIAKFGNKHRVFRVMAGGTNIQPNQGDATRFFDSFKIDASASPPTLAEKPG